MSTDAAALWRRWRSGRDERAFASLVVPELPRAAAVARAAGCDASGAEDAVQEALVALAHERSDAPVELGLRVWLYRAVRDRARSALRSSRRRRGRETRAARPEAVAAAPSRSETAELVERALAELAEGDREAVRLRCALDLEYREVAAVLGTSEGAARVRVHRALERLRERLRGDPATLLAALPLPAFAPDAALVVTKALAAASAAAGGAFAGSAAAAAGGTTMASAKALALAGLVGIGAGAVATWTLVVGDVASPRGADVASADAAPPADAGKPRSAPAPAPPERRRAQAPTASDGDAAAAAPFPAGEATLRIGQGYVLGEPAARPRSRSAGADLVCLDLHGDTAALRCPHGGRLADVPLAAVGIPRTSAEAAALVADAPDDLRPADVAMFTATRDTQPGVALVRASDGRTYRVALLEVSGEPDALERTVRLAFSEVPARPGGGRIAAPVASAADGAPSLRDLAAIVADGDAIPGASFANFLQGRYERISPLPAELVLHEGRYVLADEPLATTLEFNAYSGLVAARGIAAGGKVRVRSYTGVAVRGDMAGEIDIDSYAYVHVSGDLTGRLPIGSYATVVIDGDVRGEIDVSSYTTLLLRGRIVAPGRVAIRSSSSSIWLQQWTPRAQAEALGGNGNELHLRESDAAPGTYTDWAGWSKVVVGEDAWTRIAR